MMISRRNFILGASSLSSGAVLDEHAVGRTAAPLTIAHCGDPQFGFAPSGPGEKAYQTCLSAFERLIGSINALRPDLVCLSGDMVHDWREASRDWPRLLQSIVPRWIVTAGNHDIPDVGSKVQRDQFASIFGSLYSAVTVKGWRVLSLNGQFERHDVPDPAYISWRDSELETMSKECVPGIVLTHQPIFLSDMNEPDSYENYPLKSRKKLYDRMVDAGVRYVLAGHTHRIMTNAYRGVPELMPETTCYNFDGRPFGFRVLKVERSGNYEWSFVGV